MGNGANYVQFVVRRELRAFEELHDSCNRDFSNLEKKANDVSEEEFRRLGSQPVGEDWGGDMADLAEQADTVGQAFYDRMFPLAQTLSNLLTVGLFHLFEQHLGGACDQLFNGLTPVVDSMPKAFDWLEANTGAAVSAYAEAVKLNELRLAANTIKHSEGSSARELKTLRADLFVHPGGRGIVPPGLFVPKKVGRPLTGESVYVTDQDYAEFLAAVKQFWQTLLADLAAKGV